MELDKLLQIVVCPQCKGQLEPVAQNCGLGCSQCQVVYPIRDDIPILLVEEAIPRAEWEKSTATGQKD